MGAESRIASVVLGNYLKQVIPKVSGAAEAATARAAGNLMGRAAEFVDAPGVRGLAARAASSAPAYTPAVLGSLAGGATTLGAGIASDLAVNQLQQIMETDRQRQQQQRQPFVTPRQQAVYNSMFMAGMQQPSMYYGGF
jgi:hypothetical protein